MNRDLHRCSLYYNNGEGKRHPDETRLLVVEMSHEDEVYFNVFLSFLANYRFVLRATVRKYRPKSESRGKS